MMCLGLGFALAGTNVINGLLDGGDLLGVVIWNLGLELFFECHYEFDRVQGVSAEIVDERRIIFDLVGLQTELLGDDSSDLLFDAAHVPTPYYLTGRTKGPGRCGAYCIGIAEAILQSSGALTLWLQSGEYRRNQRRHCIERPPFTFSVSPVM